MFPFDDAIMYWLWEVCLSSTLYHLYTGAATFEPLCATTKMSRSPLKAGRRPNGCLGRSRVAHRTFRHRHGRHGHREVLRMFKTAAQRSPWSRRGCTVIGHWSPRKKCVLLWTLCINLGDASAFLLPPLCRFWLTNSFHWAITEATTVSPLGAHANHWATLTMVLPQLCLHWKAQGSSYSSYTETELSGFRRPLRVLTIFWSVKGGTEVAALCKGGFIGWGFNNDSTEGNSWKPIPLANPFQSDLRMHIHDDLDSIIFLTIFSYLYLTGVHVLHRECYFPGNK